MEEYDDDIDLNEKLEEEKNDIEILNDKIINQNIDIEEIKGPNDI